jgi:hypothetical protein
MTMTLRDLMCAVALCAFAIGAQAQSTDSSKMAAPKADMASKIEADYKAAKAVCDPKSGAEKDKCMKDADAAHAKAMKGMSASSSPKEGSTKDMSSSTDTGKK